MSIRSELIRELEQNRTKPVSGQKLAQRLHVSRNAVCKMIHTCLLYTSDAADE